MTTDASLPISEPTEAEIVAESIAVVAGQHVTELPKDLYIPPEAMCVLLESFQGPLDLLLYLIKKQNLDVLDIPIAEITRQYIAYVEFMQTIRLDLAGEYLVMAAMLAEIKSRMLLPRQDEEGEDETDPRAELVRRLQEYERFKEAAENLDEMQRVERDFFEASSDLPDMQLEQAYPPLDLQEVLATLSDIFQRAKFFNKHEIEQEVLSVRERMSIVLDRVKPGQFTEFKNLFRAEEGRMGVVVTLIAVLELIRQSILELAQSEPFAPIYVTARSENPGTIGYDDDEWK